MSKTNLATYEFDIFGIGETNLDWRLVREQDRIYHRIKEWWESTHVSYAHNCMGTPLQRQQWGGTVLVITRQCTGYWAKV